MGGQAGGRPAGRPPRSTGKRRQLRGGSTGTPSGQPDERIRYECPFCGRPDANASFRLNRYGSMEWFIRCWTPGCQGNHLPALAEAFGVDRYASKEQIVAALVTASPRGTRHRRAREPKPLPSLARVADWTRALLASGAPLRYLTERRQLALDVIEAARVGWDGHALVFPMLRRGEVVALKRRAPRNGAQMLKPSGSGVWEWPLYPEPERAFGWTYLVEGELDALRLRSAGIPAASITGGVDHWRKEWADDLRGLRVVVAFDLGFENRACERAGQLRAAGVTADWLGLRRLGLRERNADLSDYLNGGGDPARLRRRVVRRRAKR